jgi:signal transduction histidine kinase
MSNPEQPAGSDPGMEMVCRFAGNLAHELNNLLTPVVVCGQMLTDTPEPDDVAFCGEQLEDAGRRFQALTKKLQLIGSRRRSEESIRPFELLPAIIARARSAAHGPVFRELYREKADIASAGIALDLEQASFLLEELLRNAAQAMPQGGEITVDLARASDPDRLLLTVADQGEGMSPEIQARIFEPFFTTRSQARDRGLGLTLVYGMVRRAGGTIRCQSAPGAGTTMKITFPASYVP